MGNRTFVDKMRERIKMHPNKKISEEILEKFEERVDGNNKIFCTFYNSFGIAEDTIVTCEYNGNGKLYVPANVCGHRINRIGYYALFYGADIKTIELEEGIEFIERGAFLNCTNLQKLILPSTIKYIDEQAFCINRGVLEIAANINLDEAQIYKIKNSGIELADGRIVLNMIDGNLPKIEAISIVQKLLNGYPARIDKNMRALFYKRGKELKELNFRGHPSAQNEEIKAFWYKAKNNLEGYEEENCEKWEDFYNPELNYHWYGMNFETMLSIIDLKKDSKDKYKLQVIWARFFWQEYKKIVVNGNTFYVYQRNHLENQGTPYYSEEFVNVYDAESQKPLCGGLRELVIRKCLMINQIT